ncbi:NAD-dependent epimerase/dehydratase family protein [Streptomyces sp. 6N106]|uniref:NAD-dependent epimerase/dehydratase family protein n=1 Tax=Streptomyces sp. 6N106 TaxID=3457418 RepID=UPI003FD1B855
MEVFIIGATGFVGGAVARPLAGAGHHITGLARAEAAAIALEAQGITPVAGDLETRRPETISAARLADTVIYAAQADPAQETATLDELIQALAGSGRTLVFLSGSGVFLQRTAGAWSQDSFAEDDPFTVEPQATARKAVEDKVLAAAAHGIRTWVIRPGLIWGPADHGHVSMVYRSVAATGAACYVGEGLNTYSHVHVDDVTRVFGPALERGTSGALYHAVAGETANRWIAERVADDVGCGARSVDEAEAADIWGQFGALRHAPQQPGSLLLWDRRLPSSGRGRPVGAGSPP